MGGAFSEIAPRVLADAGCAVVPFAVRTRSRLLPASEPNPAVDENLELVVRTRGRQSAPTRGRAGR